MENMFEKFIFISFFNLFIISEILGSEVLKPHGIPLSRVPLYSPEHDFTCFDQSKTIPFSQVNDNYCDCMDASDEPGTSACINGQFYCTNVGHKPINIGASRVNDGICDCCDGTDEYSSGARCINNCVELGKSAREEALQREELLKVGKQLRTEYSQKGIQEKQHKKVKLLELEKNKEESERVKDEKERLKNEAEILEGNALEYYRKLEEEKNKQKAEIEALKLRTEAMAAFSRYDLNQDGKISYTELQEHQTFDKDKDAIVSEEEAKYFLNDQEEADVESFVNDAWSRIKPYLLIESGAYKKPADDDVTLESNDEEHNKEEYADVEEEDEDEPEQIETAEEPTPPIQYDEETQSLVDAASEARNEFSNAESIVRDLSAEIKDIKDYLEKDFGPDEEYAPLEGQCFEYADHEYIYKLCPFDKTVQQPKSGSLETRLGSWGKWSGPEDNKYKSMLYDRGQACWNGPQRSTLVNISCGSDNKIIAVTEPNKCEYYFEFLTPAACVGNLSDGSDRGHDEL